MYKGSCVCQKIQFEFTQVPFDGCYCHCRICRKLTGSLGGAYGAILKSSFKWISGETCLTKFQPTHETTRYFCSTCGSFLLSEHIEAPNYFYLSLGVIDSEISIDMQHHQFIDGKPNWVYLDKNLPHYSKWPK